MYYRDDNNEENYGPEEEALINKLCKASVKNERHKVTKQLPPMNITFFREKIDFFLDLSFLEENRKKNDNTRGVFFPLRE